MPSLSVRAPLQARQWWCPLPRENFPHVFGSCYAIRHNH